MSDYLPNDDEDYDDGWDVSEQLQFLREDVGDVIEALEKHQDDSAMVRRCIHRLRKALEGQLDGE